MGNIVDYGMVKDISIEKEIMQIYLSTSMVSNPGQGILSGVWEDFDYNHNSVAITRETVSPQFNLKAGKKYRLSSSLYLTGISANQYRWYGFYNYAKGGTIGNLGGSSYNGSLEQQGEQAVAIIKPEVDSVIELRLISGYTTIDIKGGNVNLPNSWVRVEEL